MISDLLDKAADTLKRDGWTNSGDFRDPDTGCLCTIGALRVAAGGRVRDDGRWVFEPEGREPHEKEARIEYDRAHDYLSDYLRKTEPSMAQRPWVALWNDAQANVEAPVNLLRSAAAQARREGL